MARDSHPTAQDGGSLASRQTQIDGPETRGFSAPGGHRQMVRCGKCLCVCSEGGRVGVCGTRSKPVLPGARGPSLCLETSAPLFSSLSSRCRWESRQRPSQTTRPNGVPRPRQCHFWLPGIVTAPCLVLRGVYQQLKWPHRLLARLFIRVSFLLLSRRGRHPIA